VKQQSLQTLRNPTIQLKCYCGQLKTILMHCILSVVPKNQKIEVSSIFSHSRELSSVSSVTKIFSSLIFDRWLVTYVLRVQRCSSFGNFQNENTSTPNCTVSVRLRQNKSWKIDGFDSLNSLHNRHYPCM
jgi:hypothetical protein